MKLRNLIILAFLFCVLSLPVWAQDATAEPTIAPMPVVVVSEGPPAILQLTIGEVIAIVLFLGGLMLYGGRILWNANQNPGGASVDTQLTELVDRQALDRERMAALERAYELGNQAMKTALDAAVSVLQAIAPLTPLKVDDATLKLLRDIQQPGAMAQAASASSTGYKIEGNQDGVTLTVDTSPAVYATTMSGTDISPDLTPVKPPVEFNPEITKLHEPGGANTGGGAGF